MEANSTVLKGGNVPKKGNKIDKRRAAWAGAIYREWWKSITPGEDGIRHLRTLNLPLLVYTTAERLSQTAECRLWDHVTEKEAGMIFRRYMSTWVAQEVGGYRLVKSLTVAVPTTDNATQKKEKRQRPKKTPSTAALEPTPSSVARAPQPLERSTVVSTRPALESKRVEHGSMATRMLTEEEAAWQYFLGQAPHQTLFGWDLSRAPLLHLQALCLTLGMKEGTLLPILGRLVDAALIKRDASLPLGWRVAYNPRNVRVAALDRRWIVRPSNAQREKIANFRKHAGSMRDKHGLVRYEQLFPALGIKTERVEGTFYDTFVRCDPRQGEAEEFGLLMHCDDDACLWVPEALAGRDLCPHDGTKETVLIHEKHPHHKKCMRELNSKFTKLATSA